MPELPEARPLPKPERSSLQSDYEASSFWCGIETITKEYYARTSRG